MSGQSHIVLDIDECLLKTFFNKKRLLTKIMTDPSYCHLRQRIIIVDCGEDTYWAIKRPHLDEFISFCFDYFVTVSVWSAGSHAYVHKIVPQIFRDSRRPFVIMTEENIYYYRGREYCKPLVDFFDTWMEVTGYEGVHEKNVLFLDNKSDNFMLNPKNGIHIPDYDPEASISSISCVDDDNLLKLKDFLLTSGDVVDVQDLDKGSVFV